MADESDDIVLIHLRRIGEKKLDRAAADAGDLKIRMGAVEANPAVLNTRVDRIDSRLNRIECRLGHVAAATEQELR